MLPLVLWEVIVKDLWIRCVYDSFLSLTNPSVHQVHLVQSLGNQGVHLH